MKVRNLKSIELNKDAIPERFVSVVTDEEYKKSIDYNVDRIRFQIFTALFVVVVLIIFMILSSLVIKFSEYIKFEFLIGLGLLLSSITTFNVLRYKPYGGDEKIYCDLTSLSKSSNLSIYDVEYKYTFNYPPIFRQLIDFSCDFGYQTNYYLFLVPALILFLLILRNENRNLFLSSMYLFGAFLALRWVLKTGDLSLIHI